MYDCIFFYQIKPQFILLIYKIKKKTTLMPQIYQVECEFKGDDDDQGSVVQSVVSLTSSLRVISLTVLADLIYNILIFFAEKM